MGPRSGQPGTLAARLQSPGRRRRKPPREAPPTGRRRLLQDLRHDLDTILRLSGRRQSSTRTRHGTGGGRRTEDTAKGRCELEWSLALYQRRLQQVLGLTRAEAGAERRRRRLKVVKLLPRVGQTSGAAEDGYEGEDEGAEVPSSIRRRLIFTTPQEECRLARVWRHLESQAEAILPKTVRARALALLRQLTDGGYISWRPDTLELIVDGIEDKGTNVVDLAELCPVRGRAQAC